MSDAEYGLVMPFVVCQSVGGPYEDEAYVAGYEAGLADALCGSLAEGAALRVGSLKLGMPYHVENQAQIDLIAMRHGVAADWEDAGEGWVYLTLSAGLEVQE